LAIFSSIARNRCPNRLLARTPRPAIKRKHREQISFLLRRLNLWMNGDFVRSRLFVELKKTTTVEIASGLDAL
jgi:hypothetical protein